MPGYALHAVMLVVSTGSNPTCGANKSKADPLFSIFVPEFILPCIMRPLSGCPDCHFPNHYCYLPWLGSLR